MTNKALGSSLLGCIVFRHVAGDNASAYLLQNSKAAGWLSWADDIATAATPPHLPLTLVHLAVNWPLKVEWEDPRVCTPSDMGGVLLTT